MTDHRIQFASSIPRRPISVALLVIAVLLGLPTFRDSGGTAVIP